MSSLNECGIIPHNEQYKEAEPHQLNFVNLLREADEIVRSKPTWRRFIDGTPLSNDIAVWMAVFAQDVLRRAVNSDEREVFIDIINDNTDADGICCADDLLESVRLRGEK